MFLDLFFSTGRRRRQQALLRAIELRNWRPAQDTTMRLLDGSSLYSLTQLNRRYENLTYGDDWQYVEVGFRARGQTGLSRLQTRTIYYGVLSVELPRQLPNVVFDSLKHRRRQFRAVFDPRQYIQLEGNFNDHFATYFGTGYTIDSLSFITPEVMEALMAADDYDIEVIRNRLLLFGPIEPDIETQIDKMSKAAHLIRKKLLNNILTYRDERVAYHRGRAIVARAGMFLDGHPVGFFEGAYIAFYLLWLAVKAAVVLALLRLILPPY